MARRDHYGIKYLSPPIIRWVTLMRLAAAKSDIPFPAGGFLDGPLDGRVILDESIVSLGREHIFNILPDHRMVPERRVQPMPVNRPLRPDGGNGLLGKGHGTRVYIGLKPGVHGRVHKAVLCHSRSSAWQFLRDG